MSVTFRLGHVIVEITTNHSGLERRLAFMFEPALVAGGSADIHISVWPVSQMPPLPPGPPFTQQAGRLAYYMQDEEWVARYTAWGQLRVRLDRDQVDAYLLPASLTHYGLLEDAILIGLAPLLRRRGLFTVHAFAAARAGRAVLLIGEPGAGKTTTGISLLRRGWSLLSNDSPLLQAAGEGLKIVRYPGLLSVQADTLRRFAGLAALAGTPAEPAAKYSIAATRIDPGIWAVQAEPAALCFPTIVPGLARSRLEPLDSRQALLALIEQSIENWDRPLLAAHLAILGRLVEQAAAYRLHLGPDVHALPDLLQNLLGHV